MQSVTNTHIHFVTSCLSFFLNQLTLMRPYLRDITLRKLSIHLLIRDYNLPLNFEILFDWYKKYICVCVCDNFTILDLFCRLNAYFYLSIIQEKHTGPHYLAMNFFQCPIFSPPTFTRVWGWKCTNLLVYMN